ncbi:troponin T, skeletal muscle-like isoform X2 [Paramacrobiotus metropolitanus]|uniref:troponin T, skeletal muscle-like isoform X2 n=1 Tax=Paramacrobiotus metropolitanus TaxID=2943436 RepID=UPI0024464269|nr:troponin T, skeletal muscle-like isoform X2 [Paramacrobiotus metropolitanus]
MADDDAWQERHEEAGEEKTEAQLLIEAKQRKHEEEEAARLRELEEQRRIEREKEEDELRRLKEKQAQRKKEREEEERKLEIQRQEAEEQRKREEEQRRQEKELEKQRKQEEAERKKAAAAAAMVGGRNFTINKEQGESSMEKFMNISKAKTEMGLNANELEVLKRRTVEDRVKPLSVSDLDFKGLQRKAEELWKQIVQLETAKYDLAERAKRQEYDLKELNERQRQINQKKYAAQGLDVEQNTRHPPKVQIISKYERRTDRRTFGDRKGLFDGSQIKDDKPELNKPKGVRRDNWIKAKETEEKRGSRQYADEEDESPTYSQPTRHEEEPEQEEVAAEDEE